MKDDTDPSPFVLFVPDGRVPEPEAAEEGQGIVPHPCPLRKRLELLGVAAADDDVGGFKGGKQARENVLNVPLPFLPAEALQTCRSGVRFQRPLLIAKTAQFQRLD